MSWRETVEPILKNWSEPHKTRMLAALAVENDMAESLGYTCIPDPKRGFGWCMFHNDAIRIWQCGDPIGKFVAWARGDITGEPPRQRYENNRYFHSLEDAFADKNIICTMGKHFTPIRSKWYVVQSIRDGKPGKYADGFYGWDGAIHSDEQIFDEHSMPFEENPDMLFIEVGLGVKPSVDMVNKALDEYERTDDGPIRDGTQGGSVMTGREHA